jgi:hypothetical protein
MNKKNMSLSHESSINIVEPSILLRINQKYHKGMQGETLYQITRGEWVIGERRNQAKYALAVYQGIVLEVFKIERWVPFTGRTPSNRQRWCFDGVVAENLQHYRGGSVRHYFVRGNQNPVKFIHCD